MPSLIAGFVRMKKEGSATEILMRVSYAMSLGCTPHCGSRDFNLAS